MFLQTQEYLFVYSNNLKCYFHFITKWWQFHKFQIKFIDLCDLLFWEQKVEFFAPDSIIVIIKTIKFNPSICSLCSSKCFLIDFLNQKIIALFRFLIFSHPSVTNSIFRVWFIAANNLRKFQSLLIHKLSFWCLLRSIRNVIIEMLYISTIGWIF